LYNYIFGIWAVAYIRHLV